MAFSKDSDCGDRNFNFFWQKKSAKRRLTQQVADLTGAPGVKLTARSSSLDHYSPSSSLIIYLLVNFLFISDTANMEVLLGIAGKDFVILAASKAAMRGPTVLKAEDDKTRQLNKHTVMAFSGESGDTVQFAEYIQANAALYSMRNDTELSPSAVANFVRGELARSLRSRTPYTVNLLLGGIDPVTEKPHLFWIDYLASLAPLPYAAHGYAQYYCLSILDKHHHPDCTLEEGLALLTLCTDELKRRLPIDYKGMLVKVVTKNGVEIIPVDNDKVVRSA
ncbi:hypothetical protein N7517_005314 [Penicillium concentricum]|uniref:Proteasome subunit beta n=1 Tax=Penicillium concentricum TaxID=293559 RepID=A0A9W9S7B9_9EURO|nr:uncharacterized protein N7517_005314 [Penicillium concentricum]KAJ5373308.1 hypothetical protein N7517_005314 [Penicillium concentricum]